MVDCNVIRWAQILLLVFLCLLFVSVSHAQSLADEENFEFEISQNEDSSLNNELLRFARNARTKRQIKVKLPKKETLRAVTAARFNPLFIGGTVNMVLALLNLFFALLNFALIFGKYNLRLRILAEKVQLSVEEVASRDMHPKIKMALSRTFAPKDPLLSQVLQLLKEPSEHFDHVNDLLPGQKEARLRRLDAPPNTKSTAAKSNAKSTTSKTPKSTGGKTKKSAKPEDDSEATSGKKSATKTKK
uniref:Transmembrane protein n=1 Tax=Caenorhabditis japonica TaxID=281687 RepID=A0A8R1DK65_CAEJA